MKTFLVLLLTIFSTSSFASIQSRLGIAADFSPMIKPSDVTGVHGTCLMNDHIRKFSFEFTNFKAPPGDFGELQYDYKANYQLKKGGEYRFKQDSKAEPVLAFGWQDRDKTRSKWITAYFGKSGPDSEGLFIDAYDWTSPFEISAVNKTVTITTKYTWIEFYDPKLNENYEQLTGGDCTWVLDLK